MPTDNKRVGARFDRPDDDYAAILRFAQECNMIRYSQFDAYTVRRVNLFALRENFNFDELEATLDVILKTLPAIKRIFAKPIIRLKDSSEILPVESARVVNNRTIIHVSGHSELWDDITSEGLKPRKLLTLNHEDDYAIYENIAFARAIDIILMLVSRNMRIMKDMLYANRELRFNLLERVNHLAYFLAIGKLHIGYVRDYDKYRAAAERCMEKLLFIDSVIRARLGSPVYKKCRRRSEKLTLKKTNVFRMHKDYHRIYLLLKWFSDAKIADMEMTETPSEGSGEGYNVFCSLLSLFAAGHFNYVFREDRLIDFFHLNVDCAFEGWKLKLETLSCGDYTGIRFTFYKDLLYRVILIPATDGERGEKAIECFKERYAAEEYLIADPFGEERSHVYLSLFDIDSFRRIQQILLRGMIRTDQKRDVCPFCGRELSHIEQPDGGMLHECVACRMQIFDLICPERQAPYTATKIKNFKLPEAELSGLIRKDRLLYDRYIESQMHFRNITDIGLSTDIICPKCGHVHSG